MGERSLLMLHRMEIQFTLKRMKHWYLILLLENELLADQRNRTVNTSTMYNIFLGNKKRFHSSSRVIMSV